MYVCIRVSLKSTAAKCDAAEVNSSCSEPHLLLCISSAAQWEAAASRTPEQKVATR